MRTMVSSIPLLRTIRKANEKWFDPENKRIFNDVNYWGYYGGKTGKPYLARSTRAWTDMFGEKPKLHYRINNVNPETKEIEELIDDEFATPAEMKAWLREN